MKIIEPSKRTNIIYLCLLLISIIIIAVIFPIYVIGERHCAYYAYITNTSTEYSMINGCTIKYNNYWVPIGTIRNDLEVK